MVPAMCRELRIAAMSRDMDNFCGPQSPTLVVPEVATTDRMVVP